MLSQGQELPVKIQTANVTSPTLVRLGHQDHQVNLDRMVSPAFQEIQENQVLQVYLEPRKLKQRNARNAPLVIKGNRAALAHQDHLDHQVRQVTKALLANQTPSKAKELQVPQVLQVPMENRVPKVHQDNPVNLEAKVQLVQKANPARLALQDPQALQAAKEMTASLVPRDHPDLVVNPVAMALQEMQEVPANPVNLARMLNIVLAQNEPVAQSFLRVRSSLICDRLWQKYRCNFVLFTASFIYVAQNPQAVRF